MWEFDIWVRRKEGRRPSEFSMIASHVVPTVTDDLFSVKVLFSVNLYVCTKWVYLGVFEYFLSLYHFVSIFLSFPLLISKKLSNTFRQKFCRASYTALSTRSMRGHRVLYSFYAFYAWWIYFDDFTVTVTVTVYLFSSSHDLFSIIGGPCKTVLGPMMSVALKRAEQIITESQWAHGPTGTGHGHGLFILATYHKGKWTTHPNPLSPSIPAQTQQRALVSEARSPSNGSQNLLSPSIPANPARQTLIFIIGK